MILTVSIWDDQVRLSLIGKTMRTLDHVSFNFSVKKDDIGIRSIDPFELKYFLRTGIQQLLVRQSVSISSIGFSFMPGYLMAWDKTTCTPVSRCLVPNNVLPSQEYQSFKFSSFYSLLSESTQRESPNVALNLWLISKEIKKHKSQVLISSLDIWLKYLLTGYDENALVASPELMSELVFAGQAFDEPLLKTLGLNSDMFPMLGTDHGLQTKNFSPLVDGIEIAYATSTNGLISKMLRQYSKSPIACVHLSKINHLYLDNIAIQPMGDMSQHWVRFSSWHSLYQSFNLTNGVQSMMDLSIDDIQDDIVVPLDPFRSFQDQSYHMLNMSSFAPQNIRKLGLLQTLFLIKFLLSQYDHRSQSGHIQKIVISMSEWNPSVLQLCIDLCQIHGIDFKMIHWLDLVHVCQYTHLNLFFSSSSKQDIFKVNQQLIPSLDPLTCYSLYQEWEHWFNKLYDYWH